MRELDAMMIATSVVAIQNGPYLCSLHWVQVRLVTNNLVERRSEYQSRFDTCPNILLLDIEVLPASGIDYPALRKKQKPPSSSCGLGSSSVVGPSCLASSRTLSSDWKVAIIQMYIQKQCSSSHLSMDLSLFSCSSLLATRASSTCTVLNERN